MTKSIMPIVTVASLCLVALSWGQSGPESLPAPKPSLPAPGMLTQRGPELELELMRLKDAFKIIGEAHPMRLRVEDRIKQLEVELATFRSIPNPFAEYEAQGLGPTEILDQLTEEQLRVLVIRLSVDMKDLRKRLEALEKASPAGKRLPATWLPR